MSSLFCYLHVALLLGILLYVSFPHTEATLLLIRISIRWTSLSMRQELLVSLSTRLSSSTPAAFWFCTSVLCTLVLYGVSFIPPQPYLLKWYASLPVSLISRFLSTASRAPARGHRPLLRRMLSLLELAHFLVHLPPRLPSQDQAARPRPAAP